MKTNRIWTALWMRRPSPAFVIACLALLAALDGRAWATGQAKAPSAKPNLTVVKSSFDVSNGDVQEGEAKCPTGTKPFSGGYAATGQFAHIFVAGPARNEGSNGYLVYANEPPVNLNAGVLKETAHVTVVAYCAPTGKPIVLG